MALPVVDAGDMGVVVGDMADLHDVEWYAEELVVGGEVDGVGSYLPLSPWESQSSSNSSKGSWSSGS